MKKFILVIALLMSTNGFSQTTIKIATARINELSSSRGGDKSINRVINVVYENGEIQTIALKSNTFKNGNYPAKDDSFVSNQKLITDFLNQMRAKGYQVSHLSTAYNSYDGLITTLIFEKKE